MRLRSKTALVTGAASGIGQATAITFAKEGAKVMCADIDIQGLKTTVDQISNNNGEAHSVTLDVTNPTQVSKVINDIVQQFGSIDILVNNAGITITGSVEHLTIAEWDKEMDINVKSIYLMSKAVWPHMKKAGRGAILNTASIAGRIGIANDAAYCASKAAVIMLTQCMAKDGAPEQIRVNCICPGFIDTPMIQGYFNDQEDPAAARDFATKLHPLGRLGKPQDIAKGYVYLASDDAEWVSGISLTIDGGLMSALPG